MTRGTHENGTANLVAQRQDILAQLGETYLALDTYRAYAEQCVIQIQKLRQTLTELEQVLQGRTRALDQGQASATAAEEVGHA